MLLIICVADPFILMFELVMPYVSINPQADFTSWVLYALINVGIYGIGSMLIFLALNSGMRRFIRRFLKM